VRGGTPALPDDSPFQNDPEWSNLRLFHEYYHGEIGLGLGASHRTGWTGVSRYRFKISKIKRSFFDRQRGIFPYVILQKAG